ncbi:MAG: hypothetical protein NTW25_08620 [Candidatus Kapabacteria bacterium]|nr:hypothetical protein [Candidatus Kapabacteria bacterium]
MELKYKLLDHPFYQAWTMGEVTFEQLSKYHRSYNEFIELMPVYWDRINKGFNLTDSDSKRIVEDETRHIGQWQIWLDKLPQTESFPKMEEILSTFANMTPSELLGAVQAFEMQQPEVAFTKKEGLLKHYGYNDVELVYFDEHMEEAAHINYGLSIKDKYANAEEFQRGFDKASEVLYNGLDLFLN